ncbi:MAG TPA: hypothetical protein ENN95_02080 [Deltaproteobacteria bacterium]|nr:hypothetical protein [Deltaproteobacteria bacterium]
MTVKMFDKKLYPDKKVVFAVGTGRCGASFLKQLLSAEKNVASSDERSPLSDTFHRYCKWYGIPVDDAGFLHHKAKEIIKDFKTKAISFESSSYLSLSVEELYSCFDASFILMVRDPLSVAESYYRKGYYAHPYIRNNPSLPPTYQESQHFHHFLGRIVPSGSEYMSWLEMSRIVKIGWFWNAVNDMVLKQFSRIPFEKTMIVRLEDFDYGQYQKIAKWIDFKTEVKEREFLRISKKHVNTNKDKDTSEIIWTENDYNDFARVVKAMSEKLGYSCDVDELKNKKMAVRLSVRTRRHIYRQISDYSKALISRIARYLKKRLLPHD